MLHENTSTTQPFSGAAHPDMLIDLPLWRIDLNRKVNLDGTLSLVNGGFPSPIFDMKGRLHHKNYIIMDFQILSLSHAARDT
jgi:hypothetical protein